MRENHLLLVRIFRERKMPRENCLRKNYKTDCSISSYRQSFTSSQAIENEKKLAKNHKK
jgi:hypothetical protein